MSSSESHVHHLKYFSRYFRPYVLNETLLVLMLITGSIGSLATPYALKIIIDQTLPHGNFHDLVYVMLVLTGVYVIRIAANIGSDIIQMKVSQGIVADIRMDILKALLQRPLDFFKKADSGEILYTVMNDVQNIQTSLSAIILVFLNDLLGVAGIVVMLFILNTKLTLISLAILPLIIVCLKYFTPILQAKFKDVQRQEEKLNTFFLEKLKNIRVIKSYNTFGYEADRLKQAQTSLLSAYLGNIKASTLNTNSITFLIAVGPVIVLIFGGSDVFRGSMTVGALIAFIQYLNRLFSPTITIMNSYTQLNRAVISMERVYPYIKSTDSIPSSGEATCSEQLEFDQALRSLTLKDVSLDLGDSKILEDINFEFKAGNIYGITGPSGCGKSSLVNLICGFLQPTTGEILVNGDTQLAQCQDWQDRIGLIEKENQLFLGSIAYNIRYGTFNSTAAAVEDAIRSARLSDVLDSLRDGKDTVINETGTLLSDGQKQRVSIARALLRNPGIVIFDEATASLDIKLEEEILKTIKKSLSNSIVIVVTHRTSSLHLFDHVLPLETLNRQLTKNENTTAEACQAL